MEIEGTGQNGVVVVESESALSEGIGSRWRRIISPAPSVFS